MMTVLDFFAKDGELYQSGTACLMGRICHPRTPVLNLKVIGLLEA